MKNLLIKFKEMDYQDKAIGGTGFTAIRNALFAIFKLILTIITPSIWLLSNCIFYILIALARSISVKSYLKIRKEPDERLKYDISSKNYFYNGLLLVFSGLAYFIISTITYYKETETIFTGLTVYTVATIAFWNLGVSIYGIIKYKRKLSPIIRATKITNYVSSMISIVTTQVVLLNEFGDGAKYNEYNALTGMIVSLIIIVIGAYMAINIKSERREKYDKSINC